MRREDLPARRTGSKGPATPGQVYWIEDSGESFVAVVVRSGAKGNDLMTVYAYRWLGDPPDDLAEIEPSDRHPAPGVRTIRRALGAEPFGAGAHGRRDR